MITRETLRDIGRRLRSTDDKSFCNGSGCENLTRETLCLRCALYGAPGVPSIKPWEPDLDTDAAYVPDAFDRRATSSMDSGEQDTRVSTGPSVRSPATSPCSASDRLPPALVSVRSPPVETGPTSSPPTRRDRRPETACK